MPDNNSGTSPEVVDTASMTSGDWYTLMITPYYTKRVMYLGKDSSDNHVMCAFEENKMAYPGDIDLTSRYLRIYDKYISENIISNIRMIKKATYEASEIYQHIDTQDTQYWWEVETSDEKQYINNWIAGTITDKGNIINNNLINNIDFEYGYDYPPTAFYLGNEVSNNNPYLLSIICNITDSNYIYPAIVYSLDSHNYNSYNASPLIYFTIDTTKVDIDYTNKIISIKNDTTYTNLGLKKGNIYYLENTLGHEISQGEIERMGYQNAEPGDAYPKSVIFLGVNSNNQAVFCPNFWDRSNDVVYDDNFDLDFNSMQYQDKDTDIIDYLVKYLYDSFVYNNNRIHDAYLLQRNDYSKIDLTTYWIAQGIPVDNYVIDEMTADTFYNSTTDPYGYNNHHVLKGWVGDNNYNYLKLDTNEDVKPNSLICQFDSIDPTEEHTPIACFCIDIDDLYLKKAFDGIDMISFTPADATKIATTYIGKYNQASKLKIKKVYYGINGEAKLVSNIYIGDDLNGAHLAYGESITPIEKEDVPISLPILQVPYSGYQPPHYTGEEQSPRFVYFNPNKLDVTGNVGIEVGKYNAVFTPKNGYCWADKSKTPRTVEWEIYP